MAKSINPATIIKIHGQKLPSNAIQSNVTDAYFSLEESYAISTTRSEGNEQLITLSPDDYVQLVFEDATTWFGNRNTLADLFPEINIKSRSADTPELPNTIITDDGSRSIVSQLALKLLNKFTKKVVDGEVTKIAEKLQKKSLEGRSGLYSVDENFDIQKFKNIEESKPVLLLLHGTASSTKGSFSELKQGNIWKEFLTVYGTNIIAFEHETLTKSPLQNVSELITQLPANIKIDILSHSRGGLVGDTLVRFVNNPEGFLDASIELFNEEGRKDDLQYIDVIQKIIASKKININRFVRVACPARGTSLLGNRVDIFINVLINLINISNPILLPIIEELKALISQVLETKNDVSVLPGLEAMNPSSVFLKALNTVGSYENEKPEGINNMLLVVSGSSKFSFSLNGLKVLLTKFFFNWDLNDLVVDTTSMYQGARRKDAIQYFFDEGNNVNHFNYFTNKKTQDAILLALTSASERISTFKEMEIENYNVLSRGIFGLEGGKLDIAKATGKRPIVLLLPGIMGSFLEKDSKPLWINYLSFAFGGLTKLKIENTDIKASGVIKTAYKDLVEYLTAFYDIEIFPFDWRHPISDAGTSLNMRILELQQLKQPISIVGHSMGGLVIRDMAINYPDTWNWLNTQPSFRTILLGTPWLGSYRIPHVLSGLDAIIKQLDTIDFIHSRGKLIDMFSKFPGLLGLLPIRNSDIDFSNKQEWEVFAAATGLKWSIPNDNLLSEFAQFRNNVNSKLDQLNHENIIYVAGKDDQTVSGYTIENGQLLFKTTDEGDQSVTWETGIPKSINRQTSLYYTTATHGGLSVKKYLFQGIKELLEKGTTESTEFSRIPLPTSSKQRGFAKESFNFEINEKSIETNLLGLGVDAVIDETNAPILKVSVSKGDMIYATYPVMLGHFTNDGIYGAEIVANKYLNNIPALKHSLGIYPGSIGTHTFFKSNKSLFKGSIVVGLGQAENLNSYQLSKTIETAVADYLLTFCKNTTSKNRQKTKIGLSSLIIGAGYGGMAIESSCRAVMQGVINANDKVQKLTGIDDLYVDELEFIELFEDKAITLFYSLANFINGNSDGMNIFWKDKKIKNLFGARKRLFVDNNVSWWQRLSVIVKDDDYSKNMNNKTLSYYSSTNNAREERKEMHHNLPLIEALLDDISIKKNWSFDKAKAIFELLIPTDFKENIRRNSPILWVLDKFTASFPWELLQTGTAAEKPLCVTAGMIRQLATSDYRPNNPVKTNNALVIGDPNLNDFSKAGQLPGAAKEAQRIFDKLKSAKELKLEDPMIKSSSDEILTALFKQDYKILHIAGHGFFDEKNPASCGVLIGKMKDSDEPMFLTPHHINQLPSTPEFVFINCCFLGRINPYAEQYSANRFKLAANIGTQLIENGVKAVIVAGWEVDDTAALEFAETFYAKMLAGYNFGDAVLDARKVVHKKFNYTNTWGAFQCYGQQHYSFDLKHNDTNTTKSYPIAQEAENDLDNLLSKSEVVFYEPDLLLEDLKIISKAIQDAKFDSAELQEKEAQAYAELNDYNTAITLYDKLFQNESAKFNVSALENYQNMVIYKETENYFADPSGYSNNLKAIQSSIANLFYLLKICETGHRLALLGSAHKRKALVLPADKKNEKEKVAAMEIAANFYRLAYEKLQDSYSFSNWIIQEFFIIKKNKEKWGQSVTRGTYQYKLPTMQQIEKILLQIEKNINANDEAQGFWDITETVDTSLCRFILSTNDKNFNILAQTLEHIWAIAGSKNKQQKQITNLKIIAKYANYVGIAPIEKKIGAFVKDR